MMRKTCGNPRLMPYGMNGANPSITCLGPCNNKSCNVMMKHPVCDFPIPPWPQKECRQLPQIPQSCLPPINVNLQMYKKGNQDDADLGGYPECSLFPPISDCNFHHEERPRRCPEGNFAVKVEAIKPENQFVPNRYPFDGRTSYKTFFEPKAIEKIPSYRPKMSSLAGRGKFDGTTLYQSEYIPYCIEPYKKPEWSKAEEFNPPHGCVDSTTTYNSAFTGSPGDPAQSTKRFVPFDPNRGPLDDRTTHKIDYIPYCIERTKGYGPDPEDNMKLCHCAPFHGETTYKVDYIPKAGSSRQSYKRSTLRKPAGKMDDKTTYKVAYEPFYYTKMCEPCMQPELYDQLYPRHPCACVSCCPSPNRYDGPPQRPSPPCPEPDTCNMPCASSNQCETKQTPQPLYKLKIKNERDPYQPTVVHIEPNPVFSGCTTCG